MSRCGSDEFDENDEATLLKPTIYNIKGSKLP